MSDRGAENGQAGSDGGGLPDFGRMWEDRRARASSLLGPLTGPQTSRGLSRAWRNLHLGTELAEGGTN
jgi:hypothetical protein